MKLPIEAETKSPVKETDRKPPFKELNHTADLRIEIVGKDEHELFRNAVASLYVLLGLPVVGDPGGCLPTAKLRIEGQEPEEALVQLLGELLYRATVERRQFMVDALSVGEQERGSLSVSLSGRWRSVTEEEMTSLAVQMLEDMDDPPPLSQPQVLFRNDRVETYATIHASDATDVPGMLAFTVDIQDGEVVVTVEEIDLGPLPIPESLTEMVTETLNEALDEWILSNKSDYVITDIRISDKKATIFGQVLDE